MKGAEGGRSCVPGQDSEWSRVGELVPSLKRNEAPSPPPAGTEESRGGEGGTGSLPGGTHPPSRLLLSSAPTSELAAQSLHLE